MNPGSTPTSRSMAWPTTTGTTGNNQLSMTDPNILTSSTMRTFSPGGLNQNKTTSPSGGTGLTSSMRNVDQSDLVNIMMGNTSLTNYEDFDDSRSTVSNDSNSSRFSSLSAHSSSTRGQKMVNTFNSNTSSSNRYGDHNNSGTSIDSSTLSWDEVQNAIKVGSTEREMDQMREKIDHLQKNNLTLSQSLYSTNKEHLLLVNTLKEKIHEVFPNILIENQKLKDQVKDLTVHVTSLETQIEKIRCESEHSRLVLENQINELKKEIESLKTKKPQSKFEKIEELVNKCIKPLEKTLKANNINIERLSNDMYQLGQFKLNVNLEQRGDVEIAVVHLSDRTVPFEDFMKTFCSKFIMK